MKKQRIIATICLLASLICTKTEGQTISDETTLNQTIYVDFGKNDGTNGNITKSPDKMGHFWNNATSTSYGSTSKLINGTNENTGIELVLTKNFSSNGLLNGGLKEPDQSLLNDLAINTATQDYFFIEGKSGNGGFRIKNLNKNRAYKFYVFGSRLQTGSEDRIGYISFAGSTGSNGTFQMTGKGIGANGENQNTSNIYNTDYIFPDFKGEINVQLAIKSGGFAHINAMKIEEYSNIDPLAVKQNFFIDLGRCDGNNGNHTLGADANNHYWNNAFSIDNFNVPKDSKITLHNSANNKTDIEITLGTKFRSNGRNSGGLITPNTNLLSDLAIGTATEDYLFIENGGTDTPGIIRFNHLNPDLSYRFHVFGSRDNTEDRIGLFTFTGSNSTTGSYKTSGTNAGGVGINRAVDHLYVSDNIRPDANGVIQFQIDLYASNFVYINAIKIEECTDQPIVRATSLTLSGENITNSGQTAKISATVLPQNATYPAIQWSVNNSDIARIDNNGTVYPKANGTAIIKASIEYDDTTLSDEYEITISGQLNHMGIKGTAIEEESDMHMITDMQGSISNQFKIYSSLKGTGNFLFYRQHPNGTQIVYGAGTTPGTVAQNGSPIATSIEGAVRITIDLTTNTYEILPITSMNIVGSSTPTGNDITKGLALDYKGNGIWAKHLVLNGGDPRFNFIINSNAKECIKRIKGTNSVIPQLQGEAHNIPMEEIRTNMNGGNFYVEINLRNYTYTVSCNEESKLRISYMGSSVANGSGATNMQGYNYMYTQLLNKRADEGRGLQWSTSNISIGGNNTTNLLDRWERDLLSNCSDYVIYGLSLGNEGIHDRGETAYNSYRDGMLKAIQQAREAGITPVIANNYTRADFNDSDYNFIKQLNLLIHEWDLPSINTLGAIDDGKGRWASGYENDPSHPNTAGHQEFFFSMVPSLFDALEAGKAAPIRIRNTEYELGKASTSKQITWTPEETMHSFTVSFEIKTNEAGTISWFENESGNGFIAIEPDGTLRYTSPLKGSIHSSSTVNTGEWHRITLTHYHAWGNTLLYVNDALVGNLPEKLVPHKIVLGSIHAPNSIAFKELFCWRAGMNAEEIAYVNQGKMLKSSLEIYAPLGESIDPLRNLAQSTNQLQLTNQGYYIDNTMYIDFGNNDGTNGNATLTDNNDNHWNNIVDPTSGSHITLNNANGQPLSYSMELTTHFLADGILNGGLLQPSPELLHDMAINTATQDYFYIEENNGSATGGIDFKNLRPDKAYRFHLFGSRQSTSVNSGVFTLSGLNSFHDTLQMGGLNMSQDNVIGDSKNQNDSHILVSEAIYPNSNGTIHLELNRHDISKFSCINALKIEEYSVGYSAGTSPIISTTPADGKGVRVARIHSASGGFNNELPENLLLDKNVSAFTNKKWCYNSANNFVIIELSDYYNVDKFVIEDCKTREPNNPNLSEYHIYVSTSGTADTDWKEVVHEENQSDVMYKISTITPTKARYIKLVPRISSNTVRIYSFQIYGRKSFDSIHDANFISIGKPVIESSTTSNPQNAPTTLFDGELKAANSKWTFTGSNPFVVVDLLDSHSLSSIKLYDAQSVSSTIANLKGYQIATSLDLQNWTTVADVNNKENENIKEEIFTSSHLARYVKLEIPDDGMPASKSITLYEFEIYGNLNVSANNLSLKMLQIEGQNLTPSFEPERTTYSVAVDKEVETINIKAEAKNATAKITGDIGEKKLIIGKNKFFFTVTTPNGTAQQVYSILVNRAAQSALAQINTISIDGNALQPGFSQSIKTYRMETKNSTVTLAATASSDATSIHGIGQIALTDGRNELKIEAISEDGNNKDTYTIVLYNTANLLSVASPSGEGKRKVNIAAYSGMTGVNENPFRLLRGWRSNLSGDTSMKWCDTSSSPFIIFSLPDIYILNRIEFRDCKMIESNWANVPAYSVYVSSTDTLPSSWTEVIHETGVSSSNEKTNAFDPIDARYVKFVPTKGDNAIRIYGFDIYGKYKERGNLNNIVSTGKTILNCTNGKNDMLTAANALDGQNRTVWEFTAQAATLEIDLEEEYPINKFALTDSLNTVRGYNISVSTNGSSWTPIAEQTFELTDKSSKTILLPAPITTRYVKLSIPASAQSATTRIKEFEIYKTDNPSLVGDDLAADADALIISPNPVTKGNKIRVNDIGAVRFYTLTGALAYECFADGSHLLPTSALAAGTYIVRLDNETRLKSSKLIVK